MSDQKRAQSNLEPVRIRYSTKYAKELIEHMTQGYSFASFAGAIGVGHQTVKEWVERYPEFRIAKEIGQARARWWWEQRGIKGLWKMEKQPQLNERLYLAIMRVRFGWRDQDPKPIDLSTKDVSQLVSDAERFLTQLKEKLDREAPTVEDQTNQVD